jgi:hypothetical protein
LRDGRGDLLFSRYGHDSAEAVQAHADEVHIPSSHQSNLVGIGGCSFQFGRTSMRLPRAPQMAQTTLRLKYAISVAAG